MRKVIGLGETILDIIFQDNQPRKAVPGGSTFNCMISLGRCKIPALFISELGNDRVGELIKSFMKENNLSSDYVDFFDSGQSPVAMAFLDESRNAEYVFYTNFPENRLNIPFPAIYENDIVIFGSYFAVNPALREKVSDLLRYTQKQKAIIYYDINFRKAHAEERLQLMDFIVENIRCSTITRCSEEDLNVLFPGQTLARICKDYLSKYGKNLIITQGAEDFLLKTPQFEKKYKVDVVTPVSAIGAGDNFNAGLVYGLVKNNISFGDLDVLPENGWDQLIESAKAFAKETCLSMDNYISPAFANSQALPAPS
ncbi:MAG: PfkB family carbohydrate kinase [Dysgonamonadaceae bacterium]|jgi:fructokinase|nr:PfkB family carbohydrate kinase [Dysgonamonadaceae bacterium]